MRRARWRGAIVTVVAARLARPEPPTAAGTWMSDRTGDDQAAVTNGAGCSNFDGVVNTWNRQAAI